MKRRMYKIAVFLMVSVVMSLAWTAQADLVVSAKTDTPYNVLPPVNCDNALSDDLVNAGSSVVSSWDITTDQYGGGNTHLYDGTLDGWSCSDAAAVFEFKVTFNTAVDIGEIRLFTGWSSTVRMNQDVTIKYKTFGDETLYTLGSQTAAGATNTRLETIWTDDASNTLIADATYLEIGFTKVSGQGTAIQEVDVIAAVPEPATMALLGIGSLGMILRKRK